MNRLIYADNAATTKLDNDAYFAMKPYLQDEFANPSNLYSFSRIPKKAIEDSRQIIAECINAKRDEIVFTSGGTEGINWAIKGVALKNIAKGKHIITSVIEHHAVLHSCSFLEELGFEVTYVPVDGKGCVLEKKIQESIRPDTTLVSIMLANNEIGTIQDLSGVFRRVKLTNSILHTDAVQATGHMIVDVENLGVDILSASAHKFNGPKGVGFAYVKRGTNLYNWLSGGKQENGLRAGTENVAGIVGMAHALKKNCDHIIENSNYLRRLSELFLERMTASGVDFIENGHKNRLPGNLNISIRDQDGEAIMHRLDLKGIIISTGSACTSGRSDISHVIKSIGTPLNYAKGTIRISLSKENTVDDVISIADAITSIVM